MPDSSFLSAVFALLEEPLAAPSANLEEYDTVSTFEGAREHFGDEVALFIEGDRPPGAAPSTIVRFIDSEIELIRAGCLSVPGLAQTGDRVWV